MKIDLSKKCKYGDFGLISDKGYQLSSGVIDFSSKLLVVTEYLSDTSHSLISPALEISQELNILKNDVVPESREHIIDTKVPKILSFDEWKLYFNYNEEVTISDDGKLKEIWQRKHDKNRNTDYYEGQLIEIQTNEILSNCESVAFSDSERKSLIESYYERQKSEIEYQKTLELGIYPKELHQEYLKELKDEWILNYLKNGNSYGIKKESGQIFLFEAKGEQYWEKWDKSKKIKTNDFSDIESFWMQFIKENDKWFEIKPWRANNAIVKYILTECNNLKRNIALTFAEHEKLYNWERVIHDDKLHRNLFWQFCPKCGKRVFYFPRYPKSLCNDCCDYSKFVDKDGYRLDFSNQGFGGGFVVYYYKNDELIKKTINEFQKIFIMDNEEYVAEEARFGGIAIQKYNKTKGQ